MGEDSGVASVVSAREGVGLMSAQLQGLPHSRPTVKDRGLAEVDPGLADVGGEHQSGDLLEALDLGCHQQKAYGALS